MSKQQFEAANGFNRLSEVDSIICVATLRTAKKDSDLQISRIPPTLSRKHCERGKLSRLKVQAGQEQPTKTL
jgi:hypothetical protein